MPYAHYGRIGDVWKHLPLCSVLAAEKPRRYVETNSAGAVYSLSGTPEQKYGVYHFYDRAVESPLLERSPYLRLLRKNNAREAIDRGDGSEEKSLYFPLRSYLGSPGLALNLLKNISEEFIFFDIERIALENVRDYARRIGLLPKVKIFEEDSVSGVYRLLDGLGKDDFIHFDPYSLFDHNPDGLSFWDAFLEAARRGIKAMLWYGFFTEREKKALAGCFRKTAADFALSEKSGEADRRLHAVEVFLDVIQPDRVIVNPGVVGCGVLTSNLSPKSLGEVEALAQSLAAIYDDSLIFDRVSGKLRTEVVIKA